MSVRNDNEGGRAEDTERQHDVSDSTLQKSGRGIQTSSEADASTQ